MNYYTESNKHLYIDEKGFIYFETKNFKHKGKINGFKVEKNHFLEKVYAKVWQNISDYTANMILLKNASDELLRMIGSLANRKIATSGSKAYVMEIAATVFLHFEGMYGVDDFYIGMNKHITPIVPFIKKYDFDYGIYLPDIIESDGEIVRQYQKLIKAEDKELYAKKPSFAYIHVQDGIATATDSTMLVLQKVNRQDGFYDENWNKVELEAGYPDIGRVLPQHFDIGIEFSKAIGWRDAMCIATTVFTEHYKKPYRFNKWMQVYTDRKDYMPLRLKSFALLDRLMSTQGRIYASGMISPVVVRNFENTCVIVAIVNTGWGNN